MRSVEEAHILPRRAPVSECAEAELKGKLPNIEESPKDILGPQSSKTQILEPPLN